MKDSQQFPFALKPDAVDQWLATTNLADTVQLSSELHQIIKHLNRAAIEKNLLFEIINLLTPTVANLSSELEQKFINENYPLDAKTHKLGRLSLHLIRELATAHYKIATSVNTDSEQLLESIHHALQLVGRHLLLSAKISERPSKITWKISSQLYQIAKQQGLLSSALNEKSQALNSNTTIDNLIKCNLLFSICNPYLLEPAEVDVVFSVLSTHCNLTDLEEAKPEAADQFCLVWEYTSSATPTAALQGKPYHSAVLLNTNRLISYFLTSKFKIPFAAFNNVQLRLSGYQKIIHTDIPAEPKVSLLFSGFDKITSVLQQQARNKKILQHSPDFGANQALKDAKLLPLAHEQAFMTSNKSDIWQTNNVTRKTNTVKLLKTQHASYLVAVSQPTNYTLDNPVIVANDNNSHELGIIRRVLTISQSNTQRILIELIPGEIQCSEILGQKNADQAILIYRSAEPVEVLLTPKPYTTGSKLKIGQSQLMLEKLTEVTPHFMRYQVSTII